MNTPLVTVITSYYNDQAFLKDAIDSVLAQTYKNKVITLLEIKFKFKRKVAK